MFRTATAIACSVVLAILADPAPARAQAAQETMDRIVSVLRSSRFATEEDGFRSISVEFWSRVRFSASVNSEGDLCGIFASFFDDPDGVPIEFADAGCNGTIEAVRIKGGDGFTYGPLAGDQRAYFDWLLPIVGKLTEAVADYKSVNPRPEVALLPDLQSLRANQEALQRIIDAAATTRLGGDPGHEDFPGEDKIAMKVFFGGDRALYFSARVDRNRYVTECYAAFEDPDQTYTIFDRRCDGTFEIGDFGRGSQNLSPTGMEKVIHGMLSDIDRFAQIALTHFSEGS